ncbi:Asparagine synthase (glutamine-hydrolyzing) [Halalkaliarchaeum sp. AArc-CO]|uniref:asparagine synthase-related protein n=1 Tax=Halalkaliarchaeum sp. AArc-CO TaxID=2866381 RepID=UPI00217D6EB7|nr:asparagine synthase-related protein [Halalkaliarchaeum sp. AArc-CO]UWG50171.1 Asparagine synthase (glutamine-hydrolyzing) [Halalkaliarchaeum sp. AArc-CO]
MPGTTVWLPRSEFSAPDQGGDSVGSSEALDSSFYETLGALQHAPDYEQEVIVDRTDVKIGVSGYASYPIRTVEDDEYFVCFEGKQYATDLSRSDLLTVGENVIRNRREWISDWIGSSDGDFVVYALEKDSGTVGIVNDVFGRLPLYVSERDGQIIITRENKFLRECIDGIDIDRLGIAQSLLFGFPLGTRTLWKGVDKIDGGSLLRYLPESGLQRERLHWFDFGKTLAEKRSVEENARLLAKSFQQSCRHRANSATSTVVSLSGGHDSRSVAAGYHSSGSSFSAATFAPASTDDRSGTTADVEIARKTANALGVDWHRFVLSSPVSEDFRLLLSMKGGMNPFTNAETLDFFRRLRAEFGSDITYVTGDGGDKAIPDLSPPQEIESFEELVSYLFRAESIVFPLKRVITLTGVSEAELRDSVIARFQSYPESNPSDMFVGFKIRERGFNWLNEGEDRNRSYFWSTSPFYSLPFFRKAMAIPAEQKQHNRLYRAFLRQLWPEATLLKDANFHVSMASPLYPGVQRSLSFLAAHPRIEDIVTSIYRRELLDNYDENVARLLLTQVRECEEMGNIFMEGEIARIGADRSSCNSQQAFNLLTMTSAVAEILCDDPCFDSVDEVLYS